MKYYLEKWKEHIKDGESRSFFVLLFPPHVSTKHKVIEEKTFHEHNGKNISMIGFGHYYSTS